MTVFSRHKVFLLAFKYDEQVVITRQTNIYTHITSELAAMQDCLSVEGRSPANGTQVRFLLLQP